MLTHLKVKNFAIVKDLDIEFKPGMTSITGETGAGKSIAIDALSLCLGGRADSSAVRTGESRAEICAEFDVTGSQAVKNFFLEKDLPLEDEEVIIRRVLTPDGKSRAYINGTSVPLNQLRGLGELLIIIHGQHAHQLLFKSGYQLDILDKYGGFETYKEMLGKLAGEVKVLDQRLKELKENEEQFIARRELLGFQLEELRRADPREKEYEDLELEYNRMASTEDIRSNCALSMQLLEDDERNPALSAVRSALKAMNKIAAVDPNLNNVVKMLGDAEISIEESYNEIRSYSENIEFDPERMSFLEKRLACYDDLAGKYHIAPEKLWEHFSKLKKEYADLNSSDDDLDGLNKKLTEALSAYRSASAELSRKRTACAQDLALKITSHMHELAMPFGEFTIAVNFNPDSQPSVQGNDDIEFLVRINPGQEPGPLSSVVSGGELSRISLAIQEIHAEQVQTPTLIFDEVDTGISGQTANVVGKLLYNLGESAQVLCVTHLPQVAAQARRQLFVSKKVVEGRTETTMIELSDTDREKEIARLLSGDRITENALASARDLLTDNQSPD